MTNFLGGALEDTPTFDCQKELHSRTMMSETGAQLTSSKDNTSWVSCLKLLMLEQIVDLKMSTLERQCFQQFVLAAALPCSESNNLKKPTNHLL